MEEDKPLSNSFSWHGYFCYVRKIIEEAPLQIIIISLLIIVILGLFHGLISKTLGESDAGAFLWRAKPLFIKITSGLLIFYLFVYPILRCFILSIGQEYVTNQKIPTMKSYTKQFMKKACKLILLSLIRFGFQTFSLGLIFYFSLAFLEINYWFPYLVLYLGFCSLSCIPVIYGYKSLLFSELMIFTDVPFNNIIKLGNKIIRKHNKTILLFKGTLLFINFCILLALALFTQKPTFYELVSLPSVIWPVISIVFDWDILYIFAFVLINTTFFIIETLFIPYAYYIYFLERDVNI